MNKLDTKTRKLIIRCLVEGQSIRSTARTADVSKNTITKLMIAAGKACADYQDRVLHDLPCKRIQVDEIWSFVYAKEKNVARAKSAPPKAGDVWTWTAICADTKLVPSWRVGGRSGVTAIEFMDDLRPRLANRVQLTSDGHKAYLEAVEGAFGGDVDYAQLVKIYGEASDSEKRYSPAACIGARKRRVRGQARPRPCLYQLRRAQQSDHAHVDPPLHPPDQCVFQEDREPHSQRGAALHVLQLLPSAFEPRWDQPCDGRWRDGSAVGHRGYCAAGGRSSPEAWPARSLQGKKFKLTHYPNPRQQVNRM